MRQAVDDASEVDDVEAYWLPDRGEREDDELLDGDGREDALCPICGSLYPCHCEDEA